MGHPWSLGVPGGSRHSEVTLGSLGEFETCPDWVPVMDTGQQFARIAIKTMGDHGSIRGPTVWQKFDTCPDWGGNLKLLDFTLSD
jgi:hypothetical protein